MVLEYTLHPQIPQGLLGISEIRAKLGSVEQRGFLGSGEFGTL